MQGSFVTNTGLFCGNIQVAAMEEVKWLDPKTRAVFFDFLVYSPNDDIFASCRVSLEFIPGGIVLPTVTVCPWMCV